jgi:tetratricopeptide (TPR) repeat protein
LFAPHPFEVPWTNAVSMTTTLIVRDATLAINGAPEKRGHLSEHLPLRVAEVAHMEPRTAEECVEVLSAVAGGEGADPEVLEALVIVALAHPALAHRLGLATVNTARRLASSYERAGDVEAAKILLETLAKHFPGQDTIERDLSQLMRRSGMAKDLVERYFARAKTLIREGRNEEAAGWLREVLQLDKNRKDAARLLRDLRIKHARRFQPRARSWRGPFALLILGLGATFVVLRELRLRREFESLPGVVSGDDASLQRRLEELDRFLERNPLWHGTLGILQERSELRVQRALVAERERVAREAVELAERERLESAELARQRGLLLFQSEDVSGAIAAFREALEFGGADWPHRASVERDLADLVALTPAQP